MGLLHAIDEEESRPRDEAQEAEAPITSKAKGAIAARVGDGVAGALSRVSCPGLRIRGRRATWRIVALAIITYTVAVNLSYFFVLRPIWHRRDALVTQKTLLQDVELLATSRDVVAGFRDGLMRGDQRMTVISEIEAMAESAGLEIIGEPGLLADREIAKDMLEYPIDLDLRGSYHEVGEFLSLLSGSPRRLVVKQVEMDVRDSATGESDVSVVVGVVSWED
jgi:hypothetical protein